MKVVGTLGWEVKRPDLKGQLCCRFSGECQAGTFPFLGLSVSTDNSRAWTRWFLKALSAPIWGSFMILESGLPVFTSLHPLRTVHQINLMELPSGAGRIWLNTTVVE